MPESELAGAKELVDAFIAHDWSGTGGSKRPPKAADWPLGILMLGVGKSQKKGGGEADLRRRSEVI